MRIESNRVSPLVSEDVRGSRTSFVVMPRIWHAAVNERNVRVDRLDLGRHPAECLDQGRGGPQMTAPGARRQHEHPGARTSTLR